MVIIGTDIDR